jgi:hypothetical protein
MKKSKFLLMAAAIIVIGIACVVTTVLMRNTGEAVAYHLRHEGYSNDRKI